MKKNRVECNGSGYTRSDGKRMNFPNPPDSELTVEWEGGRNALTFQIGRF